MFLIPFVVLFLSEITKMIIKSVYNKKLLAKWFLHPGGTPSGHASFMSSISTLTAYIKGYDSIEFIIALGVTVIIMYDARGVRATVGKHAEIINKISRKNELEEYVGHTNLEVFAGACFGVFLTAILIKLFNF